MSKHATVSWLVPTTTLAALLTGILAAVGHHCFYESLAGTVAPPPNEGYKVWNVRLSKQQINNTAGTAFAFLFKAALSVALSTTYSQLFWKALLHSSSRASLSTVDTAFSAAGNPMSLLRFWLWWRYPLLFSLALVSVLLPLAAIVPPGTLTIVQVQVTPAQSLYLPDPGLLTLNYLADMVSTEWYGSLRSEIYLTDIPTHLFHRPPSSGTIPLARSRTITADPASLYRKSYKPLQLKAQSYPSHHQH